MDNDKNMQEFEKLSFWQLLNKCSVEIPIIQRDYAQGRPNKEKIRNSFLDSLKKALSEKPIELDFIYGSEENNILQPLDGQQRLTTLFLLYWYIAKKENKLDEKVKEQLSKFTYETRTSSREFCKELVNSESHIKDDEDISYSIENKTVWFVESWKKDPTISAMLTMLDAIHSKFKDIPEVWEKLITEEYPPITFLYLKLENFGLSDDLYIKMNARGKQLTAFENFKSRFEKYIEIGQWEQEITNTENTFAHKIDSTWTDLFWKYRKKIEKKDDKENIITDYSIDEQLTNFIAGIAINYYARNHEIIENKESEEKIRQELILKNEKNITKNLINRIQIENRITELANNPTEIGPEDFPTKNAFEYLKICLDLYAKKNNEKFSNAELKVDIPLWNYCTGTLFGDFIDYSAPQWKSRVLFYAQTIYLQYNNNFDSFFDWIRIVRNIIENSTIDSASTFLGAIGLINELSSSCTDIYLYLSNNKIQSNFASGQMNEEVRKAKLIISYPDWKNLIFEIEDTDFCKGNINWVLECITKDDITDISQLNTIKDIIHEHLNKSDISNLFRRALLTTGNNDFYNYWGTWSWKTETNKKCLIKNRDELKDIFTKGWWFENYFKQLVIQLLTKDMQSIVDDYVCPVDMPDWKKRLIKEAALLEKHCQNHYFGITKNNDKCYLYGWKKRPANRSECKLVK